MSGLVNRLLAEYYAKEEMDGEGGVGLQPVGLSEVFAEEENDNLRNWVLVEAEQVVYDTETGERMDVTPEDVQELKRRGQVK